MERIVEVAIAGKSYPMNYSIGAAEYFKEMGGLGKIAETINAGGGKAYRTICQAAAKLIEQGSEYLRLTAGKSRDTLNEDELMTLVHPAEMQAFLDKVLEAVQAGSTREVMVKPAKKEDAASEAAVQPGP